MTWRWPIVRNFGVEKSWPPAEQIKGPHGFQMPTWVSSGLFDLEILRTQYMQQLREFENKLTDRISHTNYFKNSHSGSATFFAGLDARNLSSRSKERSTKLSKQYIEINGAINIIKSL